MRQLTPLSLVIIASSRPPTSSSALSTLLDGEEQVHAGGAGPSTPWIVHGLLGRSRKRGREASGRWIQLPLLISAQNGHLDAVNALQEALLGAAD